MARSTVPTAPLLLIGLIEEASKLIVPVLLHLIWRPRYARGGIVIGVASGTGFATLETVGYGFRRCWPRTASRLWMPRCCCVATCHRPAKLPGPG